MRPRPPIWLASPSRFAGLSRPRARLVLAGLALLLLVSLQSLLIGGDAGSGENMLALHEGIVAGMRSGGGFYDVATDQLRALGDPLRPFFAFPLPTLPVVQAALPPVVVIVLMIVLTVTVGMVWLARLMAGAFTRAAPLIAASVTLAAGLVAFAQWPLWPLHAYWSAPLVALSLAIRRPGLWLSAAAIGLTAALIRETAALYLVVMAACAWIEGERREAFGWAAALGLFALVLGVHAWAASHAVGPLDAQAAGWSGPGGPGLFVRGIWEASALRIVPLAIAAPIVALAAFGWAAWADPAGLRVAATCAAVTIATSLFAGPGTDWALIVTPLLLVGLVFLPDALRDLIAAAMDTRRVRVQRITR